MFSCFRYLNFDLKSNFHIWLWNIENRNQKTIRQMKETHKKARKTGILFVAPVAGPSKVAGHQIGAVSDARRWLDKALQKKGLPLWITQASNKT